MKVYILTKDSTRRFDNGTELHFNDQFICICADPNTAKRVIDRKMLCCVDFREKSSHSGRVPYDEEVYVREYEDISYTGDSEIFRIRVKEIDDIPEIKENEDLKKRVKNLEKEIEELKKSQKQGFTTKESFHSEPVAKKEAKSNVKFW